MRLRSGALASAMALAATVNPSMSLADACTGHNEIMTLRFAEIQQELKVAGAECRAASEYKRFVRAYRPALDLSDQAMLSVFKSNAAGDTGTSAYAAFKAQLVSNSLIRSARNKQSFCAEAHAEFSAAAQGQGALGTLIESGQPYVDIPFKECGSGEQPAVAQAALPQSGIARQAIAPIGAVVAENTNAKLALRPDPPELARIVPHYAAVVPAVPAMPHPAAAAMAAPQFDVAAPPAPPIEFARVVPHHAAVVPAIPAMTRPATVVAEAPRFAVAAQEPNDLVRVVPHHMAVVPHVPAMLRPAIATVDAPRIAIARAEEPRAEGTYVFVRRSVPRHSALRPAGLTLMHPHEETAAAPQIEIARAVPVIAPAREPVAAPSQVARGLARLSLLAAAMLRSEGAAQAAERPAHTRPMVAMADPAPHVTAGNTDAPDGMAGAAAAAADMLRSQTDPHPARPVAIVRAANVGTTRRRTIATNIVLPAKRGVPLSALNAMIEQSRVDQVAAEAAQAPQTPVPVSTQTAMNDQSAVALSGRADLSTPKTGHGFGAGKATTYGRVKPDADMAHDVSNASATTAATVVPQTPAPEVQNQNQNPAFDQPSQPNADQNDDDYGQAYAYNTRARERAWRRRIIDAYETYRRRAVPDDYYNNGGGDYPPPPPSRGYGSDDSWNDR